jgi:regulatory protein RepA
MDDLKALQDALYSIKPSDLSYEEWLNVGMALKDEGLSVNLWDDWSRSDSRYEYGVCANKWRSFSGSGVGVGTIFHYAETYGDWSRSRDLDWDDGIYESDYYHEVLDTENKPDEQPWEMTLRYIEIMYQPDEPVNFVVNSEFQEKRGKWTPIGNGAVRKAKDIIKDLNKYKDLEYAFGTINTEAGAWIRHNPSTGSRDENVVRFDHVLVESDSLSIEEQKKLLINLKLPITALIESGGKSVHALVKVQAKDAQEYDQKAKFLFDYLSKHSFVVDNANKNPARLSRLPGAMRDGNLQKLLATTIGCASWDEWIDHINGVDDDLPEIKSARDMFDNPTPEPPAIIDGVLRKGAKMICTGDSKSGKTCLLTNLAICIAEGWDWLDHKCMQGKVLYINMEVMQSDFEIRYRSVYKAYEKPATEQGKNNFEYWNLRGKAETLEKLAPKIIRRCRSKDYLAIIVDPIYKVQGGDENSAEAIGKFCALFDKIAEETGASMIYVHHHAKGASGTKKAMDRGSGSGVFSRDADAIIDFSGLVLDSNAKELLRALVNTEDEPIPLRMEIVLRSFRSPAPVNMFFEFPLHVIDTTGLLEGAAIEGSGEANRMQSPNNQRSDADKKEIVDDCFDAVVKSDGTAKLADMYNSPVCNVGRDTFKRYVLKFSEDYALKDGVVRKL